MFGVILMMSGFEDENIFKEFDDMLNDPPIKTENWKNVENKIEHLNKFKTS
jgi:hypothetical protein